MGKQWLGRSCIFLLGSDVAGACARKRYIYSPLLSDSYHYWIMDHGIFYKHMPGPISIPFVSSQISTLSNIQSNTSEEGSASARVQAPETRVEQRCIKSCLHGALARAQAPEVIRTYINELAIAKSKLEARASLIYTLPLLRCNEQEETVPVEMFSQSFMTWCLGAARRSSTECKFRPSAICQRYLTDARPCGPHQCRITTSLTSVSLRTNWGVECTPWS